MSELVSGFNTLNTWLSGHFSQVVKAAEVARLRGGTCIIVEDVLFLLRKNLVSAINPMTACNQNGL